MTKKNEAGLELVYNQSLKQMERWAKQEEFNEDILLQTVKQMGENVKQRQINMKEVTEQVSNQLQEWEKTAREQFLTSTTPFQKLFPLQSYEQINEQLNDIQKKTAKLVSTPVNNLLNENFVEGYMSAVERFIEYRRNGREIYMKNVKEASSLIYRNQNEVVQKVTSQMKNVFFPFSRFLEQPNEKA